MFREPLPPLCLHNSWEVTGVTDQLALCLCLSFHLTSDFSIRVASLPAARIMLLYHYSFVATVPGSLELHHRCLVSGSSSTTDG